MSFLKNVLFGLVIGVANIIPGVSGGTMAVVLNIYDRLIGAVSGLRTDFKGGLAFLIPIGLGGGIGILLFSKLIKSLLGSYPMPTNFFFIGLIIGSIPMIYGHARGGGRRPANIVSFLVAFAVMVVLALLPEAGGSGALITTLTAGSFLRLLLCACVAAACMILPGVSGSMVMMILGVYTSVLTAISDFNIPLLIPVAIGVLLGVFGGAKGIDICMRKAPFATYWAILGLVIGSILTVLRNAGFAMNLQTLAAAVTLVAGAVTSLLLARLQKRLARG